MKHFRWLSLILVLLPSVSFATVYVTSPTAGATVTSPVHFKASATSAFPVTYMRVYVDNVSVYGIAANAFDTYIALSPGGRYVVVQAWDSTGAVQKNAFNITVQTTFGGRNLLLQLPFQAGEAHIDGRYAFTNSNFLVEGAKRLRDLGVTSIFVYLYPKFRQSYPEKSGPLWPSTNPTSLAQLAQTAPYKTLFGMPFKTFVLTAYSFANSDRIPNFASDFNAAVAEEKEFYDLTRYLYAAYAGSGKTFILKHWEGDLTALQGSSLSQNISSTMVTAMINWLEARQQGIARARADAGDPSNVAVFHAVEVNRVLDYSRLGLTRVINAVVPVVKPDMVTYSSYDSTLQGSDAGSASATFTEALNVIKTLAPDPLNLGNKRILVSEYGLFEMQRSGEILWRTQAIMQTARSAGLLGAFHWQVFDNECKDSNGNYFPVATTSSARPAASNCRGLWLVRPDGSYSSVLSVLSPYWPGIRSCKLNLGVPSVTICTPASNATVKTPVRIIVQTVSSRPVSLVQVYVDSIRVYSAPAGSLDTYIKMALGTRRVTVQARDSSGVYFKQTIYVTVN